ncbi:MULTISPECIES: stage II sporulation protein P [Anaerotruncus]|jgi:stage II sporulation protein P|uniref:stage II sporulation protein P n=1 Tax=Anaerotruncus TaxID=244127 RepID=UPI00216B9411|nr:MULTISPECIES: stage II sporulation protein P [Anaerotruncus]MCI8493688.1 stage II sporulation protein P [Anaerotruncus sp.]
MNRHVRKHRPARRSPFLLTAIFVLPLSLIAAFSLSPDVGELTEKAALLSAMVNMPEGSIALLESRFADKIDESYYQEGENQVASYVEPFDDGESADSQAPSEESAPTSSTPESADGPVKTANPSPARDNSHKISEEYRGTILQENMAGSGTNLIAYGEGLLRNYTELPASEIESIMKQGMNIHLEDTPEPQVLIFHTHATESYEPYDSENYDMRNTWRSTDNTNNMIVVGDALEQALKDAGIGVVHDRTQHDYPSYNGAYERSAETIKSYLEKYPTIKIALDVHRDAIQREEDLIVKPTIEVDGKKAAQLMIITGSDDGTMNVPKWRENLRFAASLQDAIEQDTPQLTRPIFFCYRKYNMDLTTGSLLLEFGSNANTLDESVYTAQLVGKSLARLLDESRETQQDVEK